MILLVDENLPPVVAKALHPVADLDEHRVEHARDRYGVGMADIDWMADLSDEPDAAFLSLDINIRKKALERRAFQRSGLGGFWLTSKSWQACLRRERHHELVWRLVKHWPQIVLLTQSVRSQVYEVPFTGRTMRGL